MSEFSVVTSAAAKRGKKKKEDAWLFSYADVVTNLLALFVLLLSLAQFNVQKFDSVSSEFTNQSTHTLDELKKRVDDTIVKNKLSHKIKTKLGEFGLKVEFIGSSWFRSGSEILNRGEVKAATPILGLLSRVDKKYLLSLEGHTDDTNLPRGHRLKNNWQLSTARASSLLFELKKQGVKEGRMNISGFADTKPKYPIKGLTGPKLRLARSLNRRVVIRVYQ